MAADTAICGLANPAEGANRVIETSFKGIPLEPKVLTRAKESIQRIQVAMLASGDSVARGDVTPDASQAALIKLIKARDSVLLTFVRTAPDSAKYRRNTAGYHPSWLFPIP